MTSTRILLAEDNRGDIMLVQRALAEHAVDHELHIVRDGSEALNFFDRMGSGEESPCPDLMLLDINLPMADGEQVLRAFRQHPGCSATPVIVVTSSQNPRDRARMESLGISSYFCKPADYDAYLQLGDLVKVTLESAHRS